MAGVHREKTIDFNHRFYNKVKNLGLFDCGDINILKIVLDGIRTDRELMYADTRFFYQGEWFYRLVLLLMRVKRFLLHRDLIRVCKKQIKKLKSIADRKILLIDDQRTTKSADGREVSFYYENILNHIGRDKVIHLTAGMIRMDLFYELWFVHHLHFTFASKLSAKDRKFRKDLIDTYDRIEKSGLFDNEELNRIKMAIVLFFTSYRAWDSVLKHIHPERAYFINTYYTEGLLLALRQHNICSIEIQHGLFSAEDIDYVFPPNIKPIRDRAFFPDHILTYGPYWKNLLIDGYEFDNDRIEVIGYYPYVNEKAKEQVTAELKPFLGNKGVILVATQFYLEKEYCEYIKWLSGDLLKKKALYVIVVKLHPGDNPELYRSLKPLQNVRMVTGNINDYLSISDALVSIYSTTLFDALRYHVPSFALYKENFKTYIEEMEKWGVVQRLYVNESPVDKIKSYRHIQNPHFFYSPPDYEIFVEEELSEFEVA